MPPLPNTPNSNKYDGMSLSYGFAPNIIPCHIPNVQRKDSLPKGPSIGWSIGDLVDSRRSGIPSPAPASDSPVENKQVEALCQAIIVPDEDMPIYSFGYPSVSDLQNAFLSHFFFIVIQDD